MAKLLILILVVATGCSRSGLGGTCDETSDCAPGLFCGQMGAFKHQCTVSCLDDMVLRRQEPAADSVIDSCQMEYGETAYCYAEGYCGIRGDSCGGRCPPSTTKCVEGACVMK